MSRFFFLTSDEYFPRESQPTDALNKWMTKDEAAGVGIYKPPPKYVPNDRDKQLRSLLEQDAHRMLASCSLDSVIKAIEDQVRSGASITGARSIHVAVAQEHLGPPVIRALIRLGGDVNAKDESGSTPMHVAAALTRVEAMETLIAAGASIDSLDDEDSTPLETMKKAGRSMKVFAMAMGMGSQLPIRPADIENKHSILLLLTPAPIKA